MCTLDNHMSSLLAKLAADVEVVDDNARLPVSSMHNNSSTPACGHRRNRPSWQADMQLCQQGASSSRQDLRWTSSSGTNPVQPRRRSKGDTTMIVPKRTTANEEERLANNIRRGRQTSSASLPPSLRILPYDVLDGQAPSLTIDDSEDVDEEEILMNSSPSSSRWS